MSVIPAEREKEELDIKVMDQTDQVLLDAEHYINEHGWCQHMLNNEEGEVCIVGALAQVTGDGNSVDFIEAHKRLREHLGGLPGLARWNNDQCRTKEEVINALRNARRSA